MTPFNDQKAWINKNGNLTLGLGIDDAAGDSSHGYAKDDVWVPVSPGLLSSTTQPAITRVSAGVYKRTLVASTTHNVEIPFPSAYMRVFQAAANMAGANTAPHGIKVNALKLYYRVNTADLTSIALAVYTVPLDAADPIFTATELAATETGGTLTQDTNVYELLATVDAPAFVNTLDTLVVGEAVIVTPASSTCDLLGASWNISLALY